MFSDLPHIAHSRLLFLWTPICLLLLAIYVTGYALFYDHTQCFAPDFFTDSWVRAVRLQCRVQPNRYLNQSVIDNAEQVGPPMNILISLPPMLLLHAVAVLALGLTWHGVLQLRLFGCTAQDFVYLTKTASQGDTNIAVVLLRRRLAGSVLKKIFLSAIRIIYTIALVVVFCLLPECLSAFATYDGKLNGVNLLTEVLLPSSAVEAIPTSLYSSSICDVKTHGRDQIFSLDCHNNHLYDIGPVIAAVWIAYYVLASLAIAMLLKYIVDLVMHMICWPISNGRFAALVITSNVPYVSCPDGVLYLEHMEARGHQGAVYRILKQLKAVDEAAAAPLGGNHDIEKKQG